MKSEPLNLSDDNIVIDVEQNDKSIKISFINRELEILKQRISRLREEMELSEHIYGKRFVSLQNRFFLLPISVELNNNETTWIYPFLYLFENKMAVLKLEVPLIKIDMELLQTLEYDLIITKLINKWELSDFRSDMKLSEIANYYISLLHDATNISMIKYSDSLKNIILIDFDGIPKQIDSIPKKVEEELFRIICAPVPKRPNTSYEKDAREYLQKYTWGGHGVKYIAKTTGGCLSLVDKTIFEYEVEQYKIMPKTSTLILDEFYYIYNRLAADISINVELALLVILLKKENQSSDYYNKVNRSKSLFEVRKEYYKNSIFLVELQEGCFGTVSEQIEAFEQMMRLYLKPELTSNKMVAIDNIIHEEEIKRDQSFQKFVTIGGLLWTLIFGLPAIYDTLNIVSNLLWNKNCNIPYLTLENTSVGIWLLMNIIILFKFVMGRAKSN